MNKYVIVTLFLIGTLLSSSLVSAKFFEGLFGEKNLVTGQAIRSEMPAAPSVEEKRPVNILPWNPIVKETVKCVFNQLIEKDSTPTFEKIRPVNKCYSEHYGSCTGDQSCIINLKGKKGERITWKSTCGGYAYTTIDGIDDYATFNCAQERPMLVKEQVTCVFQNAFSEQKCYSEKYGSCSGKGSCIVDVIGNRGESITWKSTCGGKQVTSIDGQAEKAVFYCPKEECVEGEYRLTNYQDGHYFGVERCSGGAWHGMASSQPKRALAPEAQAVLSEELPSSPVTMAPAPAAASMTDQPAEQPSEQEAPIEATPKASPAPQAPVKQSVWWGGFQKKKYR